MTKNEVLDTLVGFYSFVLKEYEGHDFFEILPTAIADYKETLPENRRIIIDCHKDMLAGKCVAHSFLGSV